MVAKKISRLAQKQRVIEQRMQIIAPLLREGYTVREIRQEVMRRMDLSSLAIGTVQNDIKRLGQEWAKERIDDMEAFLAIELNKIDGIIREAWKAWRESLEPTERERTQRKGVPKEDADNNEITTLFVEQTKDKYQGKGEGRYLDIILRALERRHRLLGLDRVSLDLSGGITADLEIRHVKTGYKPAGSEEEVRQRDSI